MVRGQVGVRERKRGREVSRKTSEYQQWHKKAQGEQIEKKYAEDWQKGNRRKR